MASTAQPDTILGWYRKLIANKFDGSRFRRRVGRPKVDEEIERLVVRMAKENPSWGYDRIVGALANLGHCLSDQTVGNIIRRHGLAPAPKAQAGRFVERLYPFAPRSFGRDGLFHGGSPDAQRVADVLCAVLHSLGDSTGELGRIHAVPDQEWKEQQGRNMTLIESGSVKPIRLPARSRNLNSYAERWVRSVKVC